MTFRVLNATNAPRIKSALLAWIAEELRISMSCCNIKSLNWKNHKRNPKLTLANSHIGHQVSIALVRSFRFLRWMCLLIHVYWYFSWSSITACNNPSLALYMNPTPISWYGDVLWVLLVTCWQRSHWSLSAQPHTDVEIDQGMRCERNLVVRVDDFGEIAMGGVVVWWHTSAPPTSVPPTPDHPQCTAPQPTVLRFLLKGKNLFIPSFIRNCST